MHVPTPGKTRGTLRYALGGLEAGILGSLVMLGWLTLGSIWQRRSIWSAPNLFATVFAGQDAYSNQFLKTSLAGAALVVVLYGLLGLVWGVAWRERRGVIVTLAGAATGLGVYAVFFRFVWPHVRPLVALYAPNQQFQIAHMLWGMTLARSARYARNIAAATSGYPPASSLQPTASAAHAYPTAGRVQEADGEIRTGEVIL